MNKHNLRQIVWWVMAADYPFLYISAVTIESTALTIVAAAVLGAAGAIAALVY